MGVSSDALSFTIIHQVLLILFTALTHDKIKASTRLKRDNNVLTCLALIYSLLLKSDFHFEAAEQKKKTVFRLENEFNFGLQNRFTAVVVIISITILLFKSGQNDKRASYLELMRSLKVFHCVVRKRKSRRLRPLCIEAPPITSALEKFSERGVFILCTKILLHHQEHSS